MDIPQFITLVICLFMVGFLIYSKYFKRVTSLASIVTTLGILGTFGGIFYGLINFNVNDIEGSVPILLDGLKIAFATSIVGIALAIWVKSVPHCFIPIDDEDEYEGASVDDLAHLLSDISYNQKEHNEKNIKQLINIQKSLAGDEDSTLLTQIQKLRTSFSDKQDELLREFRNFSENMAENNSKALIEALTQVMKDFNAKINEQLGENFKHLNDGIGELLTWQEKYKNHIEVIVNQIDTSINCIKECEISLKNIAEKSDSFQESANKLEKILHALDKDTTLISAQLEAIDDLSEKMKNAFPSIEKNLTRYTDGFSRQLEMAFGEHNKMLETQKEKIGTIIELNNNSIGEQTKLLRKMQEGINQESINLFSDLKTSINQLMSENTKTITHQVAELDKQLGEELNKSLSTLGSQLTSLSKQFVTDYAPLTEKLTKLVNISEGIGNA